MTLKEPDASSDGALRPNGIEKLRELMRHGYAVRADSGTDGILLSHANGPDLALMADGTIDIPLGQPSKPESSVAPAPKRISWGRTLLLTILLAVYSLISTVIIINLTAN